MYTYTRHFAWWPERSSVNFQLIWLEYYYLRPDHNGYGVVLTESQMQAERCPYKLETPQ